LKFAFACVDKPLSSFAKFKRKVFFAFDLNRFKISEFEVEFFFISEFSGFFIAY